jgi:hypothetical protein
MVFAEGSNLNLGEFKKQEGGGNYMIRSLINCISCTSCNSIRKKYWRIVRVRNVAHSRELEKHTHNSC